MFDVDKIFIISLKEDVQRRQNLLETLKNVPFELHLVDRDEIPKRGCYNSHRDIIIKSKKEKCKRILIFEDDAKLLYGLDEIIKDTNNFINNSSHLEWKFLMLGYFPLSTKNTTQEGILNMLSSSCAHAYIINLENVKTPPKWTGTMMDMYFFFNKKTDNNGIYGLFPMAFGQQLKNSNISDFHINAMSFANKIFGGENGVTIMTQKIDIYNLFLFFIFLITVLLLFILHFLMKRFGLSLPQLSHSA